MKMARCHSGFTKCCEGSQSDALVVVHMENAHQGNGNGNNGPQHVDNHGRCAATPATNDEKLDQVEASPATFTVRVDALCDLVAIVVVLGQFLAAPASASTV